VRQTAIFCLGCHVTYYLASGGLKYGKEERVVVGGSLHKMLSRAAGTCDRRVKNIHPPLDGLALGNIRLFSE